MAKFRKRSDRFDQFGRPVFRGPPVIIDAWFISEDMFGNEFEKQELLQFVTYSFRERRAYVETPTGIIHGEVGSFIMKDADGQFRICNVLELLGCYERM